METVSESLDQGDRVPDLQEPHADHQREDGGWGQLCGKRRYGVLPERLEQGWHRVRVSWKWLEKVCYLWHLGSGQGGGRGCIILSFFYFNKIFRSPGSGPGRDIQRVITSHADATKIGRKIADEVRSKGEKEILRFCQFRCKPLLLQDQDKGEKKVLLVKKLVSGSLIKL